MEAGTRRRIQIFLAVALLAAGARLAWIYYQRRHTEWPPRTQTPAPAGPRTHPDFFVYLPRAYLTDFKSAQKLKGTYVWVRDGYRYAHYAYDARARRVREAADPPVIPPIHKIQIKDIVAEPSKRPGVLEVNLVFEMPGLSPPLRALTVGYCQRDDSCRFHLDDMFFLKDPRELYSHWSQDAWQAIERGEVRAGMSETQVSFALGFGSPLSPASAQIAGDRVVQFRPPGHPPVTVTFGADGNARRIE